MSDELQPWQAPRTPTGPNGSHPVGPSAAISGTNAQHSDEPDLRDILLVLRRHWILISAVALAVTAATAYAVFTAVPQYRANAVLRLQDERQMLTGGLDTRGIESVMGRQTDPLLSQMQVLRSRAVIGEVVEQQGMQVSVLEGAFPREYVSAVGTNPAAKDTLQVRYLASGYEVHSSSASARASYGESIELEGVRFTVEAAPEEAAGAVLRVLPREQAIDELIPRIVARQRERTDVFDLEFVSPDPVLAQQVVNTTAQVFNQRNVAVAQQQSRRRREFVEARLLETEAMLARAQRALTEFQSREKVFSSRDRSAAQQVALQELELRREELLSERSMFSELLAGVRQSRNGAGLLTLVSSPGVAQNPVVSQLYTQLARYEVVRDSMRVAGASATNPDYVRITQLVDGTKGDLVAAIESHISSLEARLSAADEMLRRNAAELAAMPEVQAEEAMLLLEVQTVQRMADQLRAEAQMARIAEAVEAGQIEIIDFAPVPREPISQRRGLKLAIGLFVGLLLGGGGAFLREQLNTKIKSRRELEPLLGVPVLGVVPAIEGNGRPSARTIPIRLPASIRTSNGAQPAIERPGASLVTLSNTHSAGAEAFRNLRTNLIFSRAVNSMQTLVVTSASPDEGKSTSAANLGIAFAQQGLRVVLIDADLRRARIHKIFGLSRDPGLVDVLVGTSSLRAAVRPGSTEGLGIITSGPAPHNPAELLGSERMKSIIEELKNDADLIVLDTPPVLAAGDASVLSSIADATIIVVRAGSTDREAARAAADQVRLIGGRLLGSVLNDPRGIAARYGTYYYSSYYGNEEE